MTEQRERSTLERHGSWPRIAAACGVGHGGNGPVEKWLRELARAEQESQKIGDGPDVLQQRMTAESALAAANADAERYVTLHLLIPDEVSAQKIDAARRFGQASAAYTARMEALSVSRARIREAHRKAVEAITRALGDATGGIAEKVGKIIAADLETFAAAPELLPAEVWTLIRQVDELEQASILFGIGPITGSFWSALDLRVAQIVGLALRLGAVRPREGRGRGQIERVVEGVL